MKIIYIISIILIILIFLISKKENFISSDYIINNLPEQTDNNQDFNNIFIKNNFNISKELKVARLESNITNVTNLNLVNTDIRIYLTGMTAYITNNSDDDMKNSFIKRDYAVGNYNTDVDSYDDGGIINIILIYPGFGVFLYNDSSNPDYKCEIYNYGTKPLKIKLGTPITVIGSSDSQLYNNETNTYYIGTYRNVPKLYLFKVFLVNLNKWINHAH